MAHHFETWGALNELWDAFLCDSLYMSSIVWSRMEVTFGNYPWKLLAGPSVYDDFISAPTCCLDATFSEPFRLAV